MTITKEITDNKLVFALEGRLDTVTAPDFEKEVDAIDDSITDVVIDLASMEYISSAGLRVILKAQKLMNKKGQMKIINVSDDVMEVFDITGFVDILTIE